MKITLTLEESKEITSYSDNPEQSQNFVYSLDYLLDMISKPIIINDKLHEFAMFIDNNVWVVGFTNGIGYTQGNVINAEMLVEFRTEELIDGVKELILWTFEKLKC